MVAVLQKFWRILHSAGCGFLFVPPAALEGVHSIAAGLIDASIRPKQHCIQQVFN